MARKRKRQQPAAPPPAALPWWRTWPVLLVVLVVLLGIGLLAFAVRGTGSSAGDATPVPTRSTNSGVTECQALPAFTDRLGYTERLAISTSERMFVGLVIFDGRVDLNAPMEERDVHQEPSWDDAGTLGPFVRDRSGNIFAAPVPRTAVGDIPAGSQNTIYRVDSVSGVLEPFVTLPNAPAASGENPFGILGLTYDCDTDALYASTVAGSTSATEAGMIVRVDLASKAVTEQVVGVDAIGLGIFENTGGKRLYFGLARDALVSSVALDERGDATGDIRDELSVADVGAGLGSPRVRRISFGPRAMTLYVVPFAFNLRAVSEQQQVVLRYTYNEPDDSWVLRP
jgi:hypothetical protein